MSTGTGETVRAARPIRPRRSLARWPVAVAAIIVVAAAAAILLSRPAGPVPRLVVIDQADGAVLAEREVADGERFRLEHTHSVTGRLVVETFSVIAAEIAIEEMWFDQPGPNLPTGPEPIGDRFTTFLTENGAYRVIHHGHVLGSLPLLVGSENVDHVLYFDNGERLRLLDIARVHASVEVTVHTD